MQNYGLLKEYEIYRYGRVRMPSLFGLCLYSYLDMQNALTRLRIEVPKLARNLRHVEEENTRLQYAIEAYESPQHLMQLARESASSRLKFPLIKEVVTLKQGLAIANPTTQKLDPLSVNARIALASRQP